jgi:hypothetical protein
MNDFITVFYLLFVFLGVGIISMFLFKKIVFKIFNKEPDLVKSMENVSWQYWLHICPAKDNDLIESPIGKKCPYCKTDETK